MAHVFVSYKRDQQDFAELVKSRLEKAGFDAWMDTDIRPGEQWRDEIDQALRESFACVVIMTPAAAESQYVTYEWACAWGLGAALVPILFEKTALHPRLEAFNYLDFTDKQRPWGALIDRLRELQETTPGPSTVIAPRNASPAVKRAVAALDSHLYDEREAAVDSLKDLVERDPSARQALIDALEHPNQNVRELVVNAVALLADHNDGRAVPGLLGILKDVNPHVRARAADALGEIGDARAVPALIDALSQNYPTYTAAAKALRKIGTPEALEALERAGM